MSHGPHWQPWAIAKSNDAWQVALKTCRELPSEPAAYSPAFERLIAALEPGVRSSLTGQQLSEFARVLATDKQQHLIDYRISLPWFGRRFYVTIFVGRERRSLARLKAEGQVGRRAMRVATLILAYMLLGIGGLTAIVIGYLVKSALGIDLFDGPSFLHEFFF